MQTKRFGALSSSVDPQKLSDTVTGIIMLIAGLATYFGLSSVSSDLSALSAQVSQLITLGFTFWGLSKSAFGICRKIFIAIYDKFFATKG